MTGGAVADMAPDGDDGRRRQEGAGRQKMIDREDRRHGDPSGFPIEECRDPVNETFLRAGTRLRVRQGGGLPPIMVKRR